MIPDTIATLTDLFEPFMLWICAGAVLVALALVIVAERKRFAHRKKSLRSAAVGLGFLAAVTGFIGLFPTFFGRSFLPWT